MCALGQLGTEVKWRYCCATTAATSQAQSLSSTPALGTYSFAMQDWAAGPVALALCLR